MGTGRRREAGAGGDAPMGLPTHPTLLPAPQKQGPESQAPSFFTPGESLNLPALWLLQLLTRGTVLFCLLL